MAALTNMMNGDRFPSTGAVRDVRLTSRCGAVALG